MCVRLLSLIVAIIASLARCVAQDAAITAIASLTDPARLATLTAERAANPRLVKCVYWLADARARNLDPERIIIEAQRITGDKPMHAGLVRENLLRNLKIADGLGLLTPENLVLMRRGNSPKVHNGPYAGEGAEVDHIIPRAVVPELDKELANLELMPRTLNRRKSASVGARQVDLAKKLSAAGIISPDMLARVISNLR